MSNKFNPGPTTTVGDLEVGDLIFLRARRVPNGGLPVPVQPVEVTAVTPLTDGRVRVYIKPANGGGGIERLLGDLPAMREYRTAVEA